MQFLAAIHHHSIPTEYQDIIWNAMQPAPDSNKVRDDLEDVFDAPHTFHEFCNAISAKPGKTSGGLTGHTFDHMKAWSKSLKRDVYNNLIKT